MRLRPLIHGLFIVFVAGMIWIWICIWGGFRRRPLRVTKKPFRKDCACADVNRQLELPVCFSSDGISKDTCTFTASSNSSLSTAAPSQGGRKRSTARLEWNDVLVYVMLGASSNVDALLWWLPLLGNNARLDIVFLGDACLLAGEACTDDAHSKILRMVQTKHRHQTFHLIRVLAKDSGYSLLSCKLRTGAAAIYRQFPWKRVYFKADTDTVIMPHLLLRFLQTMHAAVDFSAMPVYFGTVLEGKINLLLCGWERAAARGDISKGGLCYAQGGAGYGLSNPAMKALAMSNTSCSANADPEDMFTATVMYDVLKIVVMHCSSFTSGRKRPGAITYHYLSAKWLSSHSAFALWSPWTALN